MMSSDDGVDGNQQLGCVAKQCDSVVSINDSAQGEGFVVAYTSFIPHYRDIYAWCDRHAPPPDERDGLREEIKSGSPNLTPSTREQLEEISQSVRDLEEH